MKKAWYLVWDGFSEERRLYLTEAEATQWRRHGYYVNLLHNQDKRGNR